MKQERELSVHRDLQRLILDRAYSHDPIDTNQGQIRLIRLLEDLSEEGLIRCDIQIVNFSTKLRYRAISYVWGPETPAREIDIRGSRYTIRENLWQFLDTFREVHENDSLLWIDQLAIDQLNVLERNHQVRLMGDIFGNAFQVISWLGWPESAHTPDKNALQRHKEMRRGPTHEWMACLSWQACSLLTCPICEAHPTLHGNTPSICPICERRFENPSPGARLSARRPLCDPFRNPYWTRLWIAQEIVLAKDIVFLWGQDRLRPSDLQRYGTSLGPADRDPIVDHADPLLKLRSTSLRLAGGEGFALNQLLMTVSPANLRCTDDRDIVFGILGMVRASDSISIDYSLGADELCELLLHRAIFSSYTRFAPPQLIRNLARILTRLGPSRRWETWLNAPLESVLKSNRKSVQRGIGQGLLLRERFVTFAETLGHLEQGGLIKSQWEIHILGSIISAVLQYRRCQGRKSGEKYHRLPEQLVKKLVQGLDSMVSPRRSPGLEDQSELQDHYLDGVAKSLGGTSCQICTYTPYINQRSPTDAYPYIAGCSGEL